MPLGDYEAGSGPAGFDPIAISTRPTAAAPTALLYDLETRQTLLDSNGYARSMDPVDQEVRFCIGVELGAFPSSPTTGIDLGRLRRARSEAVQQVAVDAVNVALAGPLGRGDVRVDKVISSNDNGRIMLWVYYTNLRTAKPMRAENA